MPRKLRMSSRGWRSFSANLNYLKMASDAISAIMSFCFGASPGDTTGESQWKGWSETRPWKELCVQWFFRGSGLHYFEVAHNKRRNENSRDGMNMTRTVFSLVSENIQWNLWVCNHCSAIFDTSSPASFDAACKVTQKSDESKIIRANFPRSFYI